MQLAPPKSSTEAVEAAARVWQTMVDFVNDCLPQHGRGCVFHNKGDMQLGYVALSSLLIQGAAGSGLQEDIYDQLIGLISSGYNPETEFILLVQHNFENREEYVLQVGDLNYDGWRGVKSEEEIKQDEKASQIAHARMLRELLQRQRKGKSKKRGKR